MSRPCRRWQAGRHACAHIHTHTHTHRPATPANQPSTKQIAGLTEELGPGFAGTLFAPSEEAVGALLEELGGVALEPALAREILVRPLPLSLLQFGMLVCWLRSAVHPGAALHLPCLSCWDTP